MIRFTTKKHATLPGWVTISVDLPLDEEEVDLTGLEASARWAELVRSTFERMAGTDDVQRPSGWMDQGSTSMGHRRFRRGPVIVVASVKDGMLILSVTNANRGNRAPRPDDIARVKVDFLAHVSDHHIIEKRSVMGNPMRFLFAPQPGYRLEEAPDGKDFPVAVPLGEGDA